MPIYLDHNATTPLDPRVLQAMLPWLEGTHGNPSSVHQFGRAAHAAIETARRQVAALVNAETAQVIFTGGGTEADNLALKGVCRGKPGSLLVSAIEHAAVQGPADALAKLGWQVQHIVVDAHGCLRLDALDRALGDEVRLVSVMFANNETGAIQPVADVAARAHARGALVHCDAIQAPGRVPLDFAALGVDLLSLSAHKLNGPRGVGALIVSRHLQLAPLVEGGGQEHGLRGGTENLAGIVGFGCAAALAREEQPARAVQLRALRDRFESGLHAFPDIRVFAADAERLPNTSQIGVEGFDGEAVVMELDRRGIAVSSGSACHSASGRPSHVLLAMGLDEATARSAVRVSFGRENTEADVDAILAALRQILKSWREHARAVAW
ncbi:MAG TPA: cysteine desulfurase family protein [Gammaproteobacteria bacterium]|nr:cysteine desulfurase family protein [Gammaproteobacteria bacterium]